MMENDIDWWPPSILRKVCKEAGTASLLMIKYNFAQLFYIKEYILYVHKYLQPSTNNELTFDCEIAYPYFTGTN